MNYSSRNVATSLQVVVLSVLTVFFAGSSLMPASMGRQGPDQVAAPVPPFTAPVLLMDTESAEPLLEDLSVRFVDARDPFEYQRGHLPGAVSLPVSAFVNTESRIRGELMSAERLALRIAVRGIGRDAHVVVYDAQGGRLAARIVWILHYLGHPLVSVLEGGLTKWQAEGRRVTQEIFPIERESFPVDLVPRRIANADWVLDHLDDPDVVLIDARTEDLFDRDHIPGAVNLFWQRFLNPEMTWWQPTEVLEAMLEEAGVTKDKEIVIYSEIGETNALPYLVLRAMGYPRVRSYERGWAEWETDVSLPRAGKASPPVQLLRAAFRANRCANCHRLLPRADFMRPRPRGEIQTCSSACHTLPSSAAPSQLVFEEAVASARSGTGCSLLMGKIGTMATMEPHAAELAMDAFVDHGCARCHETGSGNATDAKLNAIGLGFQDQNLDCLDMMFVMN